MVASVPAVLRRATLALGCAALALTPLGCVRGSPSGPPGATSPAATAARNAAGLWAIRRGEAKSDQLWGVDVDREGNVYTAGYFQSPPSASFYDAVIYKLGPDGTELWRRQWGGPFEEKAFVVTVSEPLVLVGGEQRDSLDLGRSKMLLLALDASDGHVVWQWTWDSGTGYHETDGVVVDGDAIFVSGWTAGAHSSGDLAIARLNRANGRQLWVRTWGGARFDEGDGQMVVDASQLYVSGRLGGSGPLTGGQALLATFSKATGEHLADVEWGDGPYNDGLGMTSDGSSLYVTGLTIAGLNGQLFLRKLNKDLSTAWQQTWGGSGGESARSVVVDDRGDILVAGSTFSEGAGQSDIVLLSYDPSGRLLWHRTWGGPNRDDAYGLVVSGGVAFIAGDTWNGTAGMNDGVLLKADARTGGFPSP